MTNEVHDVPTPYDPRDWAHAILQDVHHGLMDKDFDKAHTAVATVLGIDPDFLDAYWCRHFIYLTADDPDDYAARIDNLTHIIRMQPNDAKAYACRARSYRMLEQYDSAIADCQRAIALDPDLHSLDDLASVDMWSMESKREQEKEDAEDAATERRRDSLAVPDRSLEGVFLCDTKLDRRMELFRKLADQYKQDGKYEEAMSLLTSAIASFYAGNVPDGVSVRSDYSKEWLVRDRALTGIAAGDWYKAMHDLAWYVGQCEYSSLVDCVLLVVAGG